MVSKVWEVMNELEMVTSKICSAREIIDASIDRIQEHQYDKAETMMSAAYEFLGYYLDEFDEKFKLAWQETVVKLNEVDQYSYLANDLLTKDRSSNFPEEYKGSTVSSVSDDCMPPWGHSDLEYLIKNKKDKVKRWVLPVQQECAIDNDGEYFVNFPDDLLEAANLKEGDSIEWVDNKDGSYLLKKVPQTYDEMISAGYTMTDDGFWIKE